MVWPHSSFWLGSNWSNRLSYSPVYLASESPWTERTSVHYTSPFFQPFRKRVNRSCRNPLFTQAVPSVHDPIRKIELSDVEPGTFLHQLLWIASCYLRIVNTEEQIPWNGRQYFGNLEWFDQIRAISPLFQKQQLQPLSGNNIVNMSCTLSNLSRSITWGGDQVDTQYSRCVINKLL